jgi:hypothetical protein
MAYASSSREAEQHPSASTWQNADALRVPVARINFPVADPRPRLRQDNRAAGSAVLADDAPSKRASNGCGLDLTLSGHVERRTVCAVPWLRDRAGRSARLAALHRPALLRKPLPGGPENALLPDERR